MQPWDLSAVVVRENKVEKKQTNVRFLFKLYVTMKWIILNKLNKTWEARKQTENEDTNTQM